MVGLFLDQFVLLPIDFLLDLEGVRKAKYLWNPFQQRGKVDLLPGQFLLPSAL
jgi:hypothetical protein